MKKLIELAEVKIVFFLIILHVWLLPKINIFFAGGIFLLVVSSWIYHKDTWSDLGLKWDFDGKYFWKLFQAVVFIISFIFFLGLFFNDDLKINTDLFLQMGEGLAGYIFWALLQQILLNGFLVNRLRILNNPENICVVSGILFMAIHAPNPTLMIATLIGGSMSAYYFIFCNRNVYVLAIAHALIAASIHYFLPDAWHHGLNIGPNYFK